MNKAKVSDDCEHLNDDLMDMLLVFIGGVEANEKRWFRSSEASGRKGARGEA